MKRWTMVSVPWALVILIGVVCVTASIPGREVAMLQNQSVAGTRVPRHTHPGEEVGYILEGKLLLEVESKSPLSLKTGDVFLIEAGRPHNVTNVGTGRARILSTYFVEKGEPITSWLP